MWQSWHFASKNLQYLVEYLYLFQHCGSYEPNFSKTSDRGMKKVVPVSGLE